MWLSLSRQTLDLISAARCRACRGATEAGVADFCARCQEQLALPEGGLQGDQPLLWCALAPYAGSLRALLLQQRPQADQALIRALSTRLHSCCASVLPGALLVPVPSWKRAGNPLPLLVAQALVAASAGAAELAPALLWRTRPTLGQHHLGRSLRSSNLHKAFAAHTCRDPAPRPLWLVDDILTTGATACAAAEALATAGYAVQGLLALARTPAPGRHRLPAVI
jgi:predicted amidophosphoribosyltransferase